jgi:protein SCO1
MKQTLRFLVTLSVVILATRCADAQIAYGKAPRIIKDPELIGKAEIEPKLGAQLPLDEVFTDHDGNEISLRDAIGGKPTIFILAYSGCPKLCNELLNDTIIALKALARLGLVAGKDYQLVRVSIDPKEPPAFAHKMRGSYLEALDNRPRSEPGFWFLTANKGQGTDILAARAKIQALADIVGFRYVADNQADIDAANVDEKKLERTVRKTKDFVHASALFILSADGKLNTVLPGLRRAPNLPSDSGWTVEELRIGLKTAADGQLGSFYARAVMRCFSYDDMSGDYKLTMQRLVWLAAPFPFLLLTIIGVAWWRQRGEKKLTEADVRTTGEPGQFPQPSLN